MILQSRRSGSVEVQKVSPTVTERPTYRYYYQGELQFEISEEVAIYFSRFVQEVR